MPKLNPFAALAEGATALSELWARDPESLQLAIDLATKDLDLLKTVVEIAESAPDLLVKQAASESPPSHVRRAPKVRKKRPAFKAAEKRATNVGTTDAIMKYVAENPKSSLREIVDAIEIEKDKVSATAAMLVKRGRLNKLVSDGLNRYTANE